MSESHPRLRAVIFDVDGVLVKSMERHFEAYRRVFETAGIKIEAHEVYANEGRRSREVIDSLAEERGLDISGGKAERMNEEKQRIFFSFGPLPLYPGVRELLTRLHERGLRTAMVTGTNRLNVENHLGGLVSKFDAVVTADDVKHTKPDPEPYLSALKKLGLRAEECVVVENAILGTRSAKAAGIRVIGVTSTLSAEDLSEADVIIPTVDQVDKALEVLP